MLSSTLLPSAMRCATRALPLATRATSSLSDPKYLAKSLGASSQGAATARHAMQKSCYFNIDFKIDGQATVYDAVQRFAAYNVGALVVTTEGKVNGIISERDYVTKIALLGKSSKTTKVHEIATIGANLIVANIDDSIEGTSCNTHKRLFCDLQNAMVTLCAWMLPGIRLHAKDVGARYSTSAHQRRSRRGGGHVVDQGHHQGGAHPSERCHRATHRI